MKLIYKTLISLCVLLAVVSLGMGPVAAEEQGNDTVTEPNPTEGMDQSRNQPQQKK